MDKVTELYNTAISAIEALKFYAPGHLRAGLDSSEKKLETAVKLIKKRLEKKEDIVKMWEEYCEKHN